MFHLLRATKLAMEVALLLTLSGSPLVAQDVAGIQAKRQTILKETLENTTLIGLFTVDRKPMKELTEERYEIKKVEPIPDDPSLWTIESRIKYGANDVTLPLVLRVEWADQTPMIVMDRVLVPGLGSFSARVVFHQEKYAGTWSHDGDGRSVGGHLFGRIEKQSTPEVKKETP